MTSPPLCRKRSHVLNKTLFTAQISNDILLKQNRQHLTVSRQADDFGILLEAAVMYNRPAATSLNEEDSTGDEILWKESYDERQFLYPRLQREGVTVCLYLMCLPWLYQVDE